MPSLKDRLRQFAYWSGLLGTIHFWRNCHTFTVFMFHRVLPLNTPEYETAEKEFTFTVTGFGKCLDFIKRHYNVVSHDEVRQAFLDGGKMPARAALITFDDGWRDTVVHALPELKRHSLPAVLFLATEVLDLQEDRWWQDWLVEALGRDNGLELIELALGHASGKSEDRASRVRRLTAMLGEMPDSRRHEILNSQLTASPVDHQMVTIADLDMLRPFIAIAGHGHSHAPLTHQANPRADLSASHARLLDIGGNDWAISFPHGAYDANVLILAHKSGFKLCYTSEPTLNRQSISPDKPLGRIHIPENQWTCDESGISAAKLATFLFFRPIAQ
ncbi:MAG: polysaccharide deacetylase family protein [Rhodocyclaceae bacterium]|nr:polysaccharide deacetylase family protein [Rhodocyclaceae bacterium]